MSGSLSLEDVYWPVVELRSRFPGGRLIKIRPDWREKSAPSGPAAELFRRHLQSARSVLDVGAGDRYWKDVLERLGLTIRYQSADIEHHHDHDFRDFLAVGSSFDAILMLELLEHLPIDLGLGFLEHAVELLNPGGVLVLGTPNARHPHQVWSADFTHIRPWPAHDLWALCTIAGLQPVEVYRQVLLTNKRRITMPVQLVLSRLLDFDLAYGLLVFAHKPALSQ
jgi:SAM-dependent methyltransferase